MKSLIVSMLLLGSGSAFAVTIDFESQTGGPQGNSLTVDGYTFEGSGGFGSTIFIVEDSTDYGPETTFLTWCISQCGLAIEAENQGLFDLHSFDFSTSDIFASGEVTVTGFLGAGGTVSSALVVTANSFSTYNFGVEWSGLERVEFSNAEAISAVIDNINVNQVPVPAAVWLFISGLGVLARMQRK